MAEQLTYEVQILVCKNEQSTYTLFIPGSESSIAAIQTLEEIGAPIAEVFLEIHNHPSGVSTPSIPDLRGGTVGTALSMIISKEGICQFSKTIDDDITFKLMDYLTKNQKDIWKLDPDYISERAQRSAEISDKLNAHPGSENLSENERQEIIQGSLYASFEMEKCMEYLTNNLDFTTSNFRELLATEYQYIVHFLDWNDDSLPKLLEGKSLLTEVT